MRVVFATETLAAGINMPARTTVICSMAKRGDLGMELLETHNMLQMAGRAGRRGLDVEGACVLVSTPFETADVANTIYVRVKDAGMKNLVAKNKMFDSIITHNSNTTFTNTNINNNE